MFLKGPTAMTRLIVSPRWGIFGGRGARGDLIYDNHCGDQNDSAWVIVSLLAKS